MVRCGPAVPCVWRDQLCGSTDPTVSLHATFTTAQFNFYNIAIGYFDNYDELYLAPSLDDSRVWAARERLVVIRREKQQHTHEKMGVSNPGEHTAALSTLNARRLSMFTSRVASHHHHTLGGMADDGAAGAALVRE